MRLHQEYRGNEILELYGDFIFFRSQCEFWFRWPVVTHLFSVVQLRGHLEKSNGTTRPIEARR
jgi:hypothetical protein